MDRAFVVNDVGVHCYSNPRPGGAASTATRATVARSTTVRTFLTVAANYTMTCRTFRSSQEHTDAS